MNEEIKKAQETLQELSGLALKYLINNFHFVNEEYVERKSQIGNLTEKIRISLNNFYGYKDSQQDLIKGKDEYIAKLCNDRAELKEHEKELIAEQHRLFDLAKEQETELKDLREFARIIFDKGVDTPVLMNLFRHKELTLEHYNHNCMGCNLEKNEFDLIKKVVEKYGN